MSEVNNYFFKDLMYNVRNGQDAWSVNEAFGCKEVAEYFAAKVAVNEKVFPIKVRSIKKCRVVIKTVRDKMLP